MEFKSVNKIIEESFRQNWDRPALSNYQGVTLNYRDVARRMAKLHIAFEQCGLQKGDKVAICSRNQANWGVSFLAALTYGAVAVPILHEFKPGNIHYLVNHSEARVLFVDEVIWEGLIQEEMPGLSVVVQINTFKFLYADTEERQNVREHLNESFGRRFPDYFGPEHLNYYEDSAEELAVINYTSGTSGFSKGVMIPYRALYSNIEFAAKDACPMLKPGMQCVSMLPSAHMYGMMFEFLYEITCGMHVHFLSRVPSPKIIMKAFSEIHPDIIIAVPLVMEKVYKTKLKPLIDRNKLKLLMNIPVLDKVIAKRICTELTTAFGGQFEEVILGGAAFNPEVEKFLNKIGFHYTVGYGMTECAPIICYAHWNKVKVGSAGRPALNMQVRIDSPDPRTIPGEVQVSGPNVCLGYYKNEQATRDSFTEDGWFRTGDVGEIKEDGTIYVQGHKSNLIVQADGNKVYPETIEAIINEIDGVEESLVTVWNNQLVALVVTQLELNVNNIREKINAALPSYSKIAKVETRTDPFEKTPKHSIKRYLYRE